LPLIPMHLESPAENFSASPSRADHKATLFVGQVDLLSVRRQCDQLIDRRASGDLFRRNDYPVMIVCKRHKSDHREGIPVLETIQPFTALKRAGLKLEQLIQHKKEL
jgi:hypothetical protein